LLLLLPIRPAASQDAGAPQGQHSARASRLPAGSPPRKPRPAQSADQPPTFSRQVEAVTVDVVVVDKKGNPVTGLTKDDFTLLDEGQPQTLLNFDVVTVEEQQAVQANAPACGFATNTAPRLPGRTFVVVFDNLNLTPLNAQRAKGAVLALLEKGLRPGDRVMLAATAGGAWWTTTMPEGREDLIALLKGLDGRRFISSGYDRMADFEAMRIYQYSDPQMARRVQERFERYGVKSNVKDQRQVETEDIAIRNRIDPVVDNKAAETYLASRTRNRSTYGAIERVMKPLADTKDRKAVLLVSEGLRVRPRRAPATSWLVEAARRAKRRALLHRHARALGARAVLQRRVRRADRREERAGRDRRRQPGGRRLREPGARHRRLLGHQEQRARAGHPAHRDRVAQLYLLGYSPGNIRATALPQARGAREAAGGDRARPARLLRADRHGRGRQAVGPERHRPADPVRARRAHPARRHRAAHDHVRARPDDARPRSRAAGGGRRHLHGGVRPRRGQAARLARHAGGRGAPRDLEAFRNDQKVELERKPGTFKGPSWYTMVREFELPAGGYQAKLVVRDVKSKKLGTVVYEFSVPPLDKLRLSSPILTDEVQAPPGGSPSAVDPGAAKLQPREAVLLPLRRLRSVRRPGTLMPRRRGRPRAAEGRRRHREPEQAHGDQPDLDRRRLAPAADPDRGPEPGDYELEIVARDVRAGSRPGPSSRSRSPATESLLRLQRREQLLRHLDGGRARGGLAMYFSRCAIAFGTSLRLSASVARKY
jgi:VWFA-related protein